MHLPLSWDDPATREAIERYMRSVRDDAPWCPWNIEFIRRINGLDTVDDVQRIVFDAEYLVLGLGDVYLGAPVAVPVDPRHRLVTTKYNPARTWTPENAVGIGGAYLCIYGMEGPGGYQFVGRTVPVWNRYGDGPHFDPETPWLLRFFDRIRWYPVARRRAARPPRRRTRRPPRLDIDAGDVPASPTTARFLGRARRRRSPRSRSPRRRRSPTSARAWEAAGEFALDDDAGLAPASHPTGDGHAQSARCPTGAVVVEPLHSPCVVASAPSSRGDEVRRRRTVDARSRR